MAEKRVSVRFSAEGAGDVRAELRGSVEGEAERFAKYFNQRGREIVEVSVARAVDRRRRGYE